ncbi:MHC class I polypeptide-related sequence B-like isoform X2 [Sciurus carolinensis]|uniref:MHC class I polypeptide-related sequence B-like isoform X2 n=1 Tax=Sciurus carolinensis TaxID=30640 RepID=UPI001FB29680|nr:MHC class I polypeptide-related sequence B-like isoform X2 [Sciurus carolinensis]
MTNSLALELTHTMLLLAGAVGAAVGAHSLHYNLTVRSQGGSVQSRSFAEGYWDHQLFLQYDSDNQGSAEPWGPWAEKPLGTENWNTEMQDLAEHIKKLKMTLADINAWQEQKGGSHSLQEIWGCEMQEDNCTRGFWNFHYDGELFISYNPETHSWMVHPSSTQTLAMKVKNSWDADGMQSKDYWVLLQEELCGKLQRYLFSWKGSSHSPGASALNTLWTGLLLQSRRPACLCVAAGGVAVIMIIVCVLWCKKRKTTSATEDFGCENTSPSSALEVTK